MALLGREVLVVDAVRTAIGRGHPEKGVFRDVHPNELLGACFTALLERTGVEPAAVGDVIVGCVEQHGEQAINVGRNAWLQAGLPASVPATTVDRQCGSGQQAVNFGAALIASGVCDLVVCGGVEHMGHVPMGKEDDWAREIGDPWPAALRDHYNLIPQGLSAELVAERWSVERERLDAISLRSHARAAAAAAAGRFAGEIVPVSTPQGVVDEDQGIRPDTSLDALGGLRPVFRPDGRVTAGNSSQISDGASALLLASADAAARLGLTGKARLVDQVTVGVDPVLMLTGPLPATQALLERNDLTLEDLDRVEVNEAFASVVAMWEDEFAHDPERLNVNGGAIALGHPLGCSGARLLTGLVHELERSDSRRGMVVMCCRGGLGTGTLLERVDGGS